MQGIELLIYVGFCFFVGVGIGAILIQINALFWMFWGMFFGKKDKEKT
tara:strand:+ start:473 stop:616 length:144 start_codon:yes stop_codon:yes gene_type:complete